MTPTISPDLSQVELSACFLAEFAISGTKSLLALLQQDQSHYVQLHQQVQLHYTPSGSRVGIRLTIALNLLAGEPRQPTDLQGNFALYFGYEVPDLDALLPVADEAPGEPLVALSIALTGISYSTARGMLMVRLAGTPLDGIALPLIDVAAFVSAGELTTTTLLHK